jgi:hypothetical protein
MSLSTCWEDISVNLYPFFHKSKDNLDAKTGAKSTIFMDLKQCPNTGGLNTGCKAGYGFINAANMTMVHMHACNILICATSSYL